MAGRCASSKEISVNVEACAPYSMGVDRRCSGAFTVCAVSLGDHRSAPSGDLPSIRAMRTMLLAVIVSLKC